ncbi:MAG: ATP-binding cassette domain-containing protein [Candidatus Onthovivens sp.]|nr:ATP-binding cassette domain-containing protein [Candidatus Onthovivens sp.]
MPRIELINVTKKWGDFVAVENLNMVIDDRAFITLLGPSGCGKTTTLRMIAGLETPTSGKIIIDDTVVFDSETGVNVSPAKRDIGFLFQNYALWPHMTVYKNIAFGLENLKWKKDKIDALVTEICERNAKGQPILIVSKSGDNTREFGKHLAAVGLAYEVVNVKKHDNTEVILENATQEGKITIANNLALDENALPENKDDGLCILGLENLKWKRADINARVDEVMKTLKIEEFKDRYPSELSGGQQQRVAIARTLAPSPKVLFMDEPLSNLDAKLRGEMRTELKRLHSDTNSTFVYVTHDQLEAMTLATKIALLDKGVLQQYDSPLTVYSKPNNIFVADFVGNPTMNFIPAKITKVKAKVFVVTFFGIEASFESKEDFEPLSEDVVIGVRPEFLPIRENGKIQGLAYSTLPSGMETTVKINLDGDILSAVQFGLIDYKTDEVIRFDIISDHIVIFDKESQVRLGIGEIKIK